MTPEQIPPPPRIKAWPWNGKRISGQWHVAGLGETTDYVRGDLFAAQAAELATLRKCVHIGMDLTNHHNAALCPYCQPDLQKQMAEMATLRAELATLRAANQRLHRRAQKAEGAIQSAQVWIGFFDYAAKTGHPSAGYAKAILAYIKRSLDRALKGGA